ncbi:MAG: low molecular weight phosphotyrosine protein phosphatase [Bdellovibrionales bacterium]|nr:low molecular weight phosphotyrosine protein phosphatase [Bdellovibrionales bacterium]
MVRVLFVCLGNICRSPAAEGIFIKMVEQAGLSHQVQIDSAGTSAHHTGEPADARMQQHAAERGYRLPSRARQFDHTLDFERFDFIITMDEHNYNDVIDLAPDPQARDKVIPLVELCRTHAVARVPDPYYGGDDGFRLVLDILEDGCEQLLNQVRAMVRPPT